MLAKENVIVVGNGMVGLRFCERLLEYDVARKYKVTVLGEEALPAYDRVGLSSCFTEKPLRDLVFSEARWYAHHQIDLRLNTRVALIDRQNQQVVTELGESFTYDRLILATGASPIIPRFSGNNLDHVFVYRTTDDVEAICDAASTSKQALVIGGGLLGLEAAQACRELGLEVDIVEREPYLLSLQVDEVGGMILRKNIEDLGIRVRTGVHVMELCGGAAVESAVLSDGAVLDVQLVVVATGIQPNDQLGRAADLALGTRGGIAVDSRTVTSDSAIYAIGECATFQDDLFGLVAPGYAMADVTAAQLLGINKLFEPGVAAAQLKLLDMEVAGIGRPVALPGENLEERVVADHARGVHKKILFDPIKQRLIGAVLIGETSEFERIRKWIDTETPLLDDPASLLAPVGQPVAPELDMDDDDIICFCSYVSYGDIRKAIDTYHLKTTADVMGQTYAAGLCGSCYTNLDAVCKHLIQDEEATLA